MVPLVPLLVVPLLASAMVNAPPTCWRYQTPDARFRVEIVARDLAIPVSIAFLPGGRSVLLAERPVGRLSIVNLRSGERTAIAGMPRVVGTVDGGLLDVILHPSFASTGKFYFAYAEPADSGNALVVERAVLRGTQVTERRRLFVARPALANDNEFGARLVLDRGFLYIGVGQRDVPEMAQRLDTHLGKIIRLDEEGRVPPDNPFVGHAGALPEIWSYGHRNPQGLAIDPATGDLWEHEHGPRGGDEINIIHRGVNYGWPVITYGIEYSGEPVGNGLTTHEGMAQPLHYWVPSIAPSGMAFYRGTSFPRWRRSVFVGSMSHRHLDRVVLDRGHVVREERLLVDRGWRVREVREGPDGLLYAGVDSGYLIRIRPDTKPEAPDGCLRGTGVDDSWQPMPGTAPMLRSARAAYDYGRRAVVAMGEPVGAPATNDTWEWNGASWRAMHILTPPARTEHVMADDPRGGVLLFGGLSTGGARLGDSWRYRDSAWVRLDALGPSARANASIASDPDHRQLFVFGGDTGTYASAPSSDLWMWDGGQWSRLAESGPPARAGAAMAYEPATRAVLLFGGRDGAGRLLADSWRWDGRRWRVIDAPGPPARAGATLLYFISTNALRLIGGRSAHGADTDVWEWGAEHWRRIRVGAPALEPMLVAADPARVRAVMVARDSASGRSATYVGIR